ncbi:MAG TPA: Ku protein [Candidatus Saccharimonadales bacterium]|nr:Ku protein [Candidatus Saccharimonadales bacterium]
MARASWQGFITIGQLGVPVRLYSASRSARPRFVQLSEKDGKPVHRVLRSSVTHEEVRADEVVRAVEVEPGKFVTLTDQELEQTGTPHLKTIDVKQFCEPGDINPIYYEKPYYITPGAGGERAYALLREALVRSDKLAITQFVIMSKEHIGALGVAGDLLVLHQLRFADEIVPRSDIKTRPLPKSNPSEVEALQRLIDRFSAPFYVNDYHDEHAEYVQQLVERKAKGLPMPRREKPSPQATPDDQIQAAITRMLDPSQNRLGEET